MTDSERSFIEESIRPGKYRRIRKFLKNVGIAAVLGAVFGTAAGVCFYATGLLADEKQTDNPEPEVSLDVPVEEASERPSKVSQDILPDGTESGAEVSGDSAVSAEMKEAVAHYGTLYRELSDYCESFNAVVVNIAKISTDEDYFENQIERTASFYGLVLQKKNDKLYILTQYDEMNEEYTYSVVLEDDTNVPATLVGVDNVTGLAVMTADISGVSRKVADGISVAKIGSSDNIRIGDMVVAIGNPMGSIRSVGYGVVCSEPRVEYLQDRKLDVYNTAMQSVEHGNGAIMDTDGKVIGIITHKFGRESSLCSFIGISDIKAMLEKLMNGTACAGIGIVPMDIGSNYFEDKDIDCGIYVSDMYADTTAMSAGIVVGDIITRIDGQKVKNVEEYMHILSGHKPGDTIYVSIYCDYASKNKTKNVEVTLSEIQ